MPKSHTDSETIDYHEDGSWTTTTVITREPVTNRQKAAAFGVLGAIMVAPVMPAIGLVLYDKVQEKRAARKARKLNSVK